MAHAQRASNGTEKILGQMECMFTLLPAAVAIAFAFVGSILICALGLAYAAVFAFLKWPGQFKHPFYRPDTQHLDKEPQTQLDPSARDLTQTDRPSCAGTGLSKVNPAGGRLSGRFPSNAHRDCPISQHPKERPAPAARNRTGLPRF